MDESNNNTKCVKDRDYVCEIMNVVTQNGQLIRDSIGRICLQHPNGTIHFVCVDRLPTNFLHDYNIDSSAGSEAPQFIDNSQEEDSQNTSTLDNVERATGAEACGFLDNLQEQDTKNYFESSGTLDYVERAAGAEACGFLDNLQEQDTQNYFESSGTLEEQNLQNIHRAHWTRSEILKLIEKYKKYKNLFDNSTIRNDKVWQKISKELQTHTMHEVQNKFKYLKQRYIKKKDNMGTKSTGSKSFQFAYFDEFENIFGKDPNIIPLSTASSTNFTDNSLKETSILNQETNSKSIEQKNKGKSKKRASLMNYLETFEKNANLREEARERRHRETLSAVNQLNNLMEQFLHKM